MTTGRGRQADGLGSKPRYDPDPRRKNKPWVMQVSLNGKRTTLRDADQQSLILQAQKALVDTAAGLPRASNKDTVRSFLKDWIVGAREDRERRDSTLRGYAVNITNHICESSIAGVRLGEFGPKHVQTLRRELRAKGLAEKTVTYIMATLKVALGDAVELELLPRNPALVARRKGRKRVAQEPRKRIQPLNDEQIDALRVALAGERLEALFLMALSLGLRRGELLGLRWSYVDLVKREVRVYWQLVEKKEDGVRRLDFDENKSEASRRTLDMPQGLVDVLLVHRDRQAFERQSALNLWEDRDLVFCSDEGGGIETTTLYRIWDRIRTAAGFTQRLHDLRHTAASQMLAQGIALHDVSKILGHASYQLTVDTYGHLYPKTRRSVADRMNVLFRALGDTATL